MEMKEKQGEHPFGDAGQLIALGLFLIAWVADSFFLNTLPFFASLIPLYLRLIAGAIILALSLYMLNAGHKVVAGDHRPEKVIADGVFRFVRHPLYSSVLLFYMALVVSTLSVIAIALWIAIFIFYNYIAGYEEKLMEMKFHGEYTSYKKKTGKWLPRL